MAIDIRAFERYRRSPNEKTTLLRLIAGAIVIALCWFAVTIAVVFAGTYGWVAFRRRGRAFLRGGPRPRPLPDHGRRPLRHARHLRRHLARHMDRDAFPPPREARATLRQQRPPFAFGLPQRPGRGADHLAAHRTRLSRLHSRCRARSDRPGHLGAVPAADPLLRLRPDLLGGTPVPRLPAARPRLSFPQPARLGGAADAGLHGPALESRQPCSA